METVNLGSVEIISDPDSAPSSTSRSPSTAAPKRLTLQEAELVLPNRLMRPQPLPGPLGFVGITEQVADTGTTVAVTSIYRGSPGIWVALTQFPTRISKFVVPDAITKATVGGRPAAMVTRRIMANRKEMTLLSLFWEQDGSLLQAHSAGLNESEIENFAAAVA